VKSIKFVWKMKVVPVPGDIGEDIVQKVSKGGEETFKHFNYYFQLVRMVTGD
jgi:hypothetical protein